MAQGVKHLFRRLLQGFGVSHFAFPYYVNRPP